MTDDGVLQLLIENDYNKFTNTDLINIRNKIKGVLANRKAQVKRKGFWHSKVTGKCHRGHELTEENIYTAPGRRKTRLCRKCGIIRANRYRAKVAAIKGHVIRPNHSKFCYKGHELTEQNIIKQRGARVCRVCFNATRRRHYQKKKLKSEIAP